VSPTLRSIFGHSTFNQLFVRQQDNFSCAAACYTTVARLYRLDPALDLKFFQKALRVTFNGAQLSRMKKVSAEYLPEISAGNNSYHGGIAVGCIRYKPDGLPHAVLFLGRRADTVVYYDPLDHRIWRDQVSNMRRANMWTANFPSIPTAGFDFWLSKSEPNPFPIRKQAFWIKERRV
jgi:hypothetical protein